MKKRKLNTSRYDRAKAAFLWHVEWQFPAANAVIHDDHVKDSEVLRNVLEGHLALKLGNATKRHTLRQYVEAGVDSLTVVMRKEHCKVGADAVHDHINMHARYS